MEYNGFLIEPNWTGYVNYDFYRPEDETITGNGVTIEDCKNQINEINFDLMWDTKKEIQKHEKLISILELIGDLNNRILRNIKDEKMAEENDFWGIKKRAKERIEIDQKIKQKLINYYNNLKYKLK